ncbi:MAG: hypothetical protein ABL867_08650 [Rickettsiales bacterium]
MNQKDWQKLVLMSEAEIEQNAKDDIDNPPFSLTDSSLRTVMLPDGVIVRQIFIEQKIDSWLREHNLQADKVAAALLKQFVEAQSEIK